VRKRSGIRFSSILALVALAGLAVVLAGIFPFRQIIAQNRAVDLAEHKLEAIRSENARLEARITALQTPEEVERLAREQFGLVRPGEIGYVVITPPEPAPEPDVVEEVEERPPWWEQVWDYLTGRDLVGDG
jgi:cell division protein FtsB